MEVGGGLAPGQMLLAGSQICGCNCNCQGRLWGALDLRQSPSRGKTHGKKVGRDSEKHWSLRKHTNLGCSWTNKLLFKG